MTPLKITAGMVAAELRRLADALDKEPDARCDNPFIYFSAGYGEDAKERFLTMARLMPRPWTKKYTETEVEVAYNSPAMRVRLSAPRDSVCTLIEPAKPAVYECVDSFLSPEEEAGLDATETAIREEEERECVANNGQFGVGA